jgi:hypothetical protein
MQYIWFGEIRIGTVSSSSGIFIGSNKLLNYKHASKQNQAFGTVEGQQCMMVDINNWVEDEDIIDTNLHRKQSES